MPTPRLIAIDGPAASGKSSIGRALAATLGYRFLDTGLMYRAFTLVTIEGGIAATDGEGCARLAATIAMELVPTPDGVRVVIDGRDVTDRLTEVPVEDNVSAYSRIPAVREAMVRRQRAFADGGRAVLAGRDIGTVVLPEAEVKLYLEASHEARAARRSAQAGVVSGAAWDNLALRDHIDSSRETSPLRPAEDARVLDTTGMTLGEVIAAALEVVGCAAV